MISGGMTAGSVYALLPAFDRYVAEPRKLLPNVREDKAMSTATMTTEIPSDRSITRRADVLGERISPPA